MNRLFLTYFFMFLAVVLPTLVYSDTGDQNLDPYMSSGINSTTGQAPSSAPANVPSSTQSSEPTSPSTAQHTQPASSQQVVLQAKPVPAQAVRPVGPAQPPSPPVPSQLSAKKKAPGPFTLFADMVKSLFGH